MGLRKESQPSIKVDSKSLRGKFVQANMGLTLSFFIILFFTGRGLFCELSHFPQHLSARNKNIPFPSLKPTKDGKLYVQQKHRSSSMQMKLALCCRRPQKQKGPFCSLGRLKDWLSSPFSPFCPVFFVMHIFMSVVTEHPAKSSH